MQGQLLEAADAKNRDQAHLSVMHIDVAVSGPGFHDPSLDLIASSFSLKAQCGCLFNPRQRMKLLIVIEWVLLFCCVFLFCPFVAHSQKDDEKIVTD